jgi:hypothetical protein
MFKSPSVSGKSILITMLLFFSGCCGCYTPSTYCTNVNSTSLTAYDNSDSVAVPANAEPVPGEAFYLELKVDNQSKVCYYRKAGLINSVYALTCPTDKYHYLDSITKISLTSDLAYAEGYPAGAELNVLFTMPDEKHLNSAARKSNTDIYPLSPPAHGGTYTFTVRIFFADNTVKEAVSNPITLVK